jgi:UDPglucose 6-dehydrogenase
LLDEVARINDEAIEAIAGRIKDAAWNLKGKRVAVLGLAFKAGTDDVRLSPALALVGRLRSWVRTSLLSIRGRTRRLRLSDPAS